MEPLAPLPIDLPPVEEVARMPAGFRAGAVAAGIKASGRPDVGVLAVSGERPASVAATFTANLLPAAPVRLSRAHLAATGGRAVAVLSTSGCANAATGRAGEQDQAQLAELLGEALGVAPELTMAVSTGLIGTRLPVGRIRRPLHDLVSGALASSDDALAALGEQMCTTDTRTKAASVGLDLPAGGGAGRRITVSGVAKGVGMIHPRMATMLAFVATDATAEPKALRELLPPVVRRTWNQLSVDGDTSTNDTVFLLASGAAGAAAVEAGSDEAARLSRAIEAVARSLARQQAADGEGATTLISCQVSGARDEAEGRAIARAVVSSNLFKAAVHGRDPNWGRIVAAAGNATVEGRPVALEEGRLRVAICGTDVFAGEPLAVDRAALARLMDAPEMLVRVDVGLGAGTGEAFGCDLTEEYVVENSAYST